MGLSGAGPIEGSFFQEADDEKKMLCRNIHTCGISCAWFIVKVKEPTWQKGLLVGSDDTWTSHPCWGSSCRARKIIIGYNQSMKMVMKMQCILAQSPMLRGAPVHNERRYVFGFIYISAHNHIYHLYLCMFAFLYFGYLYRCIFVYCIFVFLFFRI